MPSENSSQYDEAIQAAAKAFNVDPNVLHGIAYAESRYNPKAVSPKGAVGMMQFMPDTAKRFGVDPNDPEQAVFGAAQYLKENLDKFGGDYGKAVAAYNWGENRKEYGEKDWVKRLPKETDSYVENVLSYAANRSIPQSQPQSTQQPVQLPDLPIPAEATQQAKPTPTQLPTIEVPAQNRWKRAGELTARNALEGVETAVTYPVRAVGSAASALMKLAGAKDAGDWVEKNWGVSGNVGRVASDMAGLAKPETKLEKAVAGGSKAIAGLGVGGAANKLAEGASAGTKAVVNALAPSAGSAKEAATYGALGAGFEAAPVETAAGLAALAAAKGGAKAVAARSAENKLMKGANNIEQAAVDAEIIKDLQKKAENSNLRGNQLTTYLLNNIDQQYPQQVQNAIKKVNPNVLKELDVQNILAGKRTATPDELMAIRGTTEGDALADSIIKMQRARSLTQQVHASGSVPAILTRMAVKAVPSVVGAGAGGLPGAAIGGVMTPLMEKYAQRLTGKMSRAEVADRLLTDRYQTAAENILAKTGPSQASESYQNLLNLVNKSQQSRNARAKLSAEAKAASKAQEAANKIGVLQDTRMPLGGGFQELLQGGRSNLNLQSKEAIDALRLAKNRFGTDSPIGQAADQLLKSQPVKDENAFYGLQNWLRKTQESGVLAGGQPPGALSGVSPVRNPIAYKANVENAMGALKTATENAPSQDLAQFARKVAGTKSIADKEKLIADRIKNASQEEADFLNQFVSPLTNFGKK